MDSLIAAAILCYLIVLVIIGAIIGRKQSTEDFLLGERKLGIFSSSLSILASKIGGGLLLAFVGYVIVFGWGAAWYLVGTGFGYILFYFFSRKLKQRADKNQWYSLLDLIREEYGFKAYVCISSVTVLAYILTLVIQVIGAATIIEQLVGISYSFAVALVLGSILLYLLGGGFRAVVITDAIQAISFVFLLIILSVGLFATQGVSISVESAPITLIIGFFLIGTLLPFSSHELYQRVYATKKEAIGRSLLFATSGYLIVGITLLIIGFAVTALVPNANPESALLQGLLALNSPGFLLVAVLAFFAVIMSSADTYIFSTTSILIQDILRKKENIKHAFRISFVALTLVAGIIAATFANLLAVSILSVILMSYVAAAVLLTTYAKHRKLRNKSLIIASAVLIIAIMFLGIKPSTVIVTAFSPSLIYGILRIHTAFFH